MKSRYYIVLLLLLVFISINSNNKFLVNNNFVSKEIAKPNIGFNLFYNDKMTVQGTFNINNCDELSKFKNFDFENSNFEDVKNTISLHKGEKLNYTTAIFSEFSHDIYTYNGVCNYLNHYLEVNNIQLSEFNGFVITKGRSKLVFDTKF